MSYYFPNSEEITGASLSGSSGDANRTYVLGTTETVITTGMNVVVSSVHLHNGADKDFTYAGGTITFLHEIDDSQPIHLFYFTIPLVTGVYTPTSVSITGASLSGLNNTADRTYTLVGTVYTDGIEVYVNGVFLHEGVGNDYTYSSNIITFLHEISNDQVIDISYFTTDTSVVPTTTIVETGYGTTLELARFMNIESTVPDMNAVGTARTYELVGTGDTVTLVYYLDYARVLADSYSIYYGTAYNELIETDDYVLNKDYGIVTLTAAGKTKLGVEPLYASYSYSMLTDTQLQNALDRAEEQIDAFTNNHFADSTDDTPDWVQHLDEAQDGKGAFNNNYFTLQNYPIPNVSTTLTSAITAGDATINVTSTNGFPSTGYIQIEDDKIEYTGKTSTTFTGCTSVSAHANSLAVQSYIIEISTTNPGGTVDWQVLEEGTDYSLNMRTGRIQLMFSGSYDYGRYYDDDSMPPRHVANRFRVSYLSGWSNIPSAVAKVTMMLASRDIMASTVRKAHTGGLNDFNPKTLDVDAAEIEKTLSYYRNEKYMRV